MTPPPDDDRTDGRGTRSAPNQQGGAGQSSRQGGQQQTGDQAQQQNPPQERSGPAGWFASAALRTGIVIIGFILFLFALGQAVGFDLLDLFLDAVTSPMGRWIVVAIFALLLIAVASRGLNRPLYGR